MGLDELANRPALAGTNDNSAGLRHGIYSRPGTPEVDTTPAVNDARAPQLSGADIAFLPGTEAALPRYADNTSYQFNDLTIEASLKLPSKSQPSAEALSRVAHDSVGSSALGNRVPRDAREFPGMAVEQNHKCASTSSAWLVQIGMMTNKDFKIRVDDMMTLLPSKGFQRQSLSGNLDPSKFPDGPIGFITGRGNKEDGSSHIGFIEKRNGELRVIHNNWRTGRVVDQPITQKFYNPDGTPAYRELNLFKFPRRTTGA